MIPEKTIKELSNKHSILEKDLSYGTIDKKILDEKSKAYSDYNEKVEDEKNFITNKREKREVEKILNDSSSDEELKNMAETELIDLPIQHEIHSNKFKLFLLPKYEADTKNAIIKIRAGIVGLEASLFSSYLIKIYDKIHHKITCS